MFGKSSGNKEFHFKPINDEELLKQYWQKEREKVLTRIQNATGADTPPEISDKDTELGEGGWLHYYHLHGVLGEEWKEATGRFHDVWKKGKLPKKKDVMPIVLIGYTHNHYTLFLQALALQMIGKELEYYQHEQFHELRLLPSVTNEELDLKAEIEKEKENEKEEKQKEKEKEEKDTEN